MKHSRAGRIALAAAVMAAACAILLLSVTGQELQVLGWGGLITAATAVPFAEPSRPGCTGACAVRPA